MTGQPDVNGYPYYVGMFLIWQNIHASCKKWEADLILNFLYKLEITKFIRPWQNLEWVYSIPLTPPSPAMGAAYGTAKSGVGIAAMSVMRPELIMKCIIPVVMAGILAIYGLVVSVLLAGQLDSFAKYSLYK